jgi:uncharacterized membrane protein YqhA
MKRIYRVLKFVISTIAVLVAMAGVALALIGIYEFVIAVSHVASADREHVAGLIATGLLKTVDMFLMVIVFFVFALGVLILFDDPENTLPVRLPHWLQIKTFIQLKVILWEAILTTLVVSYLAGLAEKKFDNHTTSLYDLVIPAAILLIALSLFFLKKGEGKEH